MLTTSLSIASDDNFLSNISHGAFGNAIDALELAVDARLHLFIRRHTAVSTAALERPATRD